MSNHLIGRLKGVTSPDLPDEKLTGKFLVTSNGDIETELTDGRHFRLVAQRHAPKTAAMVRRAMSAEADWVRNERDPRAPDCDPDRPDVEDNDANRNWM